MADNVDNKKVKIGVSIGGRHVTAEVFDQKYDSLDLKFHDDLNPEGSSDETLGIIVATLRKTMEACLGLGREVVGIGIGAPGPMNMDSGEIYNTPNLKGLRDVPLKALLEKELGVPVYVNNDANVQGLGELLDEDRDCQDLILFTLGSGTGVAHIKDRKIVNGRHYMGNEHAVTKLWPTDFGVENVCSVQGIIGLYFMHRGALEKLGGEIDPKKIADLARAGYEPAIRAYEYMGRELGQFTAIMINALDPESVVYSGGIAEAYDLFVNVMLEVIEKHTNRQAYHGITGVLTPVRIRRSNLGERAQIVGAAMLVPDP